MPTFLNRRPFLPAACVTALLMMAAGRAYAVWVESRIVPADLDEMSVAMDVKTKQVDGLTQFEVTVHGRRIAFRPS